jgi:WD40 repeat protein
MKIGHVLQGHTNEVRALTFSEDGKYLASGSSDKVLYLWDIETLSIKGEATTIGEIDGIEWYPKTSTFITADGTGAIIRWDVKDLEGTLAPFENLLKEIESQLTDENRDSYVQKFEDLCSQHDDETLATKKIFYIVWQCKRALGLLKGKVTK